jgi:hypothetical protein
MTVNIGGPLLLVDGDYLERDDNERKYVICNKEKGVFVDFTAGDDGDFIIKYGRQG